MRNGAAAAAGTVPSPAGPDRPDDGFDAFVASVRPGLLRLGAARTGSWAAAEDLVQDALADAHRRWAEIGAYRDPASWARRAVLNRSVSRFRRQGREQRALDRLGRQPAPAGDEPSLSDPALWRAIRGLPDRQRDVVLLLWFEELTVAEVADTLECGVETVRTHWRRARARLAAELGEAADDPAGPSDEEVRGT